VHIKKLDTVLVVADCQRRVFPKACLEKKKVRWFITDLLDEKITEGG